MILSCVHVYGLIHVHVYDHVHVHVYGRVHVHAYVNVHDRAYDCDRDYVYVHVHDRACDCDHDYDLFRYVNDCVHHHDHVNVLYHRDDDHDDLLLI